MTDVKLEVNEKEIPLNDLMKDILSNIIQGYLKSAKKLPDDINKINKSEYSTISTLILHFFYKNKLKKKKELYI